jgi:hypothetical protein
MYLRRLIAAALAVAIALPPFAAWAQYNPTTNSIVFLGWTTGARPASPTANQCGYNTTIGAVECWTGSAWTTTVASFNGRAGIVLLSSADVTGALTYIPINPSAIGAASGVTPLDGNALVPYANLPASVQEVGLALSWVGVPGASQRAQTVVPFPCVTLANLASSQSWVNTEATGTPAFALSYIHAGSPVAIGNATLSSSSHTAAFPTATAVNFVAGDVLVGTAPATADATAADIAITVYCLRTTP